MERDEQGNVALVFEPLTAIAGGILGGAAMASCLWAAMWAIIDRRTRSKQP